MENLQRKLSEISGGKILDVGTGRGEFIGILKEFLKDYTEIIGIDQTDRSIEFCEDKFKDDKNIHFIKMSGEKIEFEDNSFDMVCLSNTLHHLPDSSIILQEMKRVLKPNGMFVVNEMYCDNQTDEQLSHVMFHHYHAKIDSLYGNYHDETYKRDQIIEICENLNLHDLDILDYRYISDNPKDAETIKFLTDTCDKSLDRVKDHEDFEKFKEESIKLKDWVKTNGFQSATELIVIGKK